MATTTNYSWTTPDDTALVKDGAAAIRSLGTAIDTTVFTNAGNAIAKTIVDAKGDIIAATAADTVARLAVGTNGQVLTADSTTATGLAYTTISAGGMTLLSTTTLSGASTTISSINQTYTDLVIVIHGITSPAESNTTIRPNGTTSICWAVGARTGSASIAEQVGGNFAPSISGVLATGGRNASVITLHNYASSSIYKTLSCSTFIQQTATPLYRGENYAGGFNLSSAITSLVFDSGGTSYSTGTVLLYGVK